MRFTSHVLLLALFLAPAFGETKVDKIRLTMPKIESSLNAFENVGELMAGDPALRKQAKELDKSIPESEGDQRLGIMVDKLSAKDSRVAAAFSKAGISANEAGGTLMMLFASAMGDAMLQPGQPVPKDMDPVLADNLKFYRAHKGELTQSMKKFEDLTKKFKSDDDSNEE